MGLLFLKEKIMKSSIPHSPSPRHPYSIKTACFLPFLFLAAVVFIGCDLLNEKGFNSQSITVQNNVSTLGLTGTDVLSNNTGIATAAIESGVIKISSAAEGYATISVSDGSGYAAISTRVSNTGSINIVYISKHSTGSGTNYNVIWGNFDRYAVDEAAINGIIAEKGWAVTSVADGKYATGSVAQAIRTYFIQSSSFTLGGGRDGTFTDLLNYTVDGVGLPPNLKTALSGQTNNVPIAGLFKIPVGSGSSGGDSADGVGGDAVPDNIPANTGIGYGIYRSEGVTGNWEWVVFYVSQN
jgi:hypothetical protein